MAYDKVINSVKLDADIKKICDAIRNKTGSASLYTFPSGMVDAINGISTGGGNGSNNCEAHVVTVPNYKVNFATKSGTLKAWGFATGTQSGYQRPSYGFSGDKYERVGIGIGGGGGTPTSLNLSIDAQGNLTGLPSLAEGTLLITRGV